MFSAESFILSAYFMLDFTACSSPSTVSGAFCLNLRWFWKMLVEESNPLLKAHNANDAKYTGGKATQKHMSIVFSPYSNLKNSKVLLLYHFSHLHICLGFSFPLRKKALYKAGNDTLL